MYSVFNTLHTGVGVIIVNIAAGKIYKEFNARILFLIASLLALMWSTFLLIFILALKLVKLLPKRRSEEMEMLQNKMLDKF